MVGIDLLAMVATMPPVPLDAQAAAEATMSSGLGTLISYGLLMISIVLSIGSLFALGAAGISRMSQDAGRQSDVSTYLASAGIMLGIAAILGAGPEIMSALGFETFQYISPVNVFTG